jgi:hypothetical protein
MVELRGTVSSLGNGKSAIVAILSIVTGAQAPVYVLNSLFEFPIQILSLTMPFYEVPSLIITCLFVKPLVKVVEGKYVEVSSPIKKRELAIAATASVVMLTVLLTGEINVDRPISSMNYSFTAKIRTIVAGKDDWNVPWILFDYTDQNNYYYFLLHKDSILKL